MKYLALIVVLALSVGAKAQSYTYASSCVGSSSTATTNCAETTNGVAGNLVIVASKTADNTAATMAASSTLGCVGGAWTVITPTNAVGVFSSAVAYCVLAASGPNTVTVTWTGGSGTFTDIAVAEYHSSTGFPASPLDVAAAKATGSSTTCASGNTASTTNTNDLVVGVCWNFNSAQTYTNGTTGYTARSTSSRNTTSVQDKLVTSTGVQSFSAATTSDVFVSWAIPFKLTSASTVAISLQPNNGTTLPGSIRRYYPVITGTTNFGVTWSISGAGTLASTSIIPAVVTSTGSGAACSFQTTSQTTPSFTSTQNYVLTATSVADPTKTASLTVAVCAPGVMLSVTPGKTLYKNQYAVVQSDLRGSTNTAVTWAITTNPGGAGTITGGTTNRHAIFSASAAGTYVVTATSVADGTKTASATYYVTSNTMPAMVTKAQRVDPTATGAGSVCEIGPTQTFSDLNAIALNTTTCRTFRIHNEDAGCSTPTTYANHISFPQSGTDAIPVRFVGVPDSCGNGPVLTGDSAVSRSDANWAGGSLENVGFFTVYDGPHKFDFTADGSQYIIIEGIHFKNVGPTHTFIAQTGGASVAYDVFAPCVRIQTGHHIMVRGNWFENCGQGVFMNSNVPLGSFAQDNMIEENYFTNWGIPTATAGSDRSHAVYDQGVSSVVQFNYFGAATNGPAGNVVKMRVAGDWVRWNYIYLPPSAARAMDFVEPQSFNCYITPRDFSYVYHGAHASTDCNGGATSDPTTADYIAANYEAYRNDYAAGNILDDDGSGSAFIHWQYDQQTVEGPAYERHAGQLWTWNNTFYSRSTSSTKNVFDYLSTNQGNSYEFGKGYSINNAFGSAGLGYIWNVQHQSQMEINTNYMLTGYGLPNRCALVDFWVTGDTAAELAACDIFGNGTASNGQLTWSRNGTLGTAASTLYTGTATPFSASTFVPTSTIHSIAATLPTGIADQPSNMQMFPASGLIAPILDNTFLGALDQNIPAPTLSSMALTPNPGSVTVGSALALTCTATMSDGSNPSCASQGTVTWASTVPAKATVNSSGSVTGVAAGTTSITATIGAITSPGDTITVTAATGIYYVAKTGLDTNNCLSPGAACLTIGHAQALATAAGAIIQVAAGTYTENVTATNAGTSGNLITFRGQDGSGCPTTSVSDVNHPTGTRPASTVNILGSFTIAANYVAVDCFHFLSNGGGAVNVNSGLTGGSITNNEMDGNSKTAPGGGVYFAGVATVVSTSYSTNFTISNNYIHGVSNGYYGACSSCTFTNNEIMALQGDEPGSDHDYIDAWGISTVFRHNYMHDNTSNACNNYDCHMDCIQTFNTTGDGKEVSKNITFDRNVCFNHHEGVIVQDNAGNGDIANWTVTNNVFAYGPYDDGSGHPAVAGSAHPWCWVFEQGALGTSNTFYNNTCISGTMGFRTTTGSASFKDNIYYTSGTQTTIYSNAGATVTGANNLYYAAGASFGGGSFTGDVINQNPQPISLGTGSAAERCIGCNYNIQTTSAAKNAGVSTSPTVTVDLLGTPRPQGASYDIGAYEFITTAPPHVVSFGATQSIGASVTF